MIDWLPWLFLGAMAVFALGWTVARVDIKELLVESRTLPQAYFKGLNFLLNEQQDKAIESFMEVTRTNPEAVELQFALGGLFRRRGEVDRAIRVHQELSERTSLTPEQRANALIELAMDYQKAGLLEHAEQIIVDAIAKRIGNPQQQLAAMKNLLDIYVQERAWRKAIDTARQLTIRDQPTAAPGHSGEQASSGVADDYHQLAIANYYCELALQAQQYGNDAEVDQHLQKALTANPKCVRANLIRAGLLADASRHLEAIAQWLSIEKQDAAFLGLAIGRMWASYQALGETDAGLAELNALQQRNPSLDLLDGLFQATLAQGGATAARQLIRKSLHRNPTLQGLEKFYEVELLDAPEERRVDAQVFRQLLHTHASRLAVYLCRNCGFKAKQYYWQCPACSGWETFPPKLTVEYDMAVQPSKATTRDSFQAAVQ